MFALEIDDISKRFGRFTAVQNLSFRIAPGTIYGLLGPNGAGKTTTIRMIMNIIIPDEGRILVHERTMDEDMKRRIGYLPEDRGLYPKMKVGDILRFLTAIKGVPKAEIAGKIDFWLKKFELMDWKMKKVDELSKGMQQKIQFIVTVIHEPDLIILDEPFSGLDPVNTKLIKDIMLELKSRGKTIIFSTHRMEQVEMICDNICLINKARMVLEGGLAGIKKQFGKNTILLDYEGDLGFVRDFPGVDKVDDYGRSAEIRLKEKAEAQDVLTGLVGRIRINKFEIQEPSLNAIFIEKVGRSEQ